MKWLLIISFTFVMATPGDYDDDCTKYYDFYDISCDHCELQADIPIKVDSSSQYLKLYKPTGSIGSETFTSVPEVTTLILERADIRQIEDGSLCSLPKLENLIVLREDIFPVLSVSNLNNCQDLKSFEIGDVPMEPTVFSSMVNLEQLKMRFANMSHLTKEYLEPLENLKVFRFCNSPIWDFDPNVLCISSKIEKIVIRYVKLPTMKGLFGNCNNVKNLSFAYHYKRGHMQEGVFHDLANLKNLDIGLLNNTQLTKAHFTGLANLESLILYESDIETIESDAFSDLISLHSLSLLRNKLKDLNPGTFETLRNLRELNLRRNQLKSIDALRNPNLEDLYVDCYLVSTIDVNSLKSNLPELKALHTNKYDMNCTYSDQITKDLTEKNINLLATYFSE